MKARKRFGQHFLVDDSVVDRIVAAVGIRPGDLVVEIGPGRAALTRRLSDVADRLVLVEIDRDLVPFLRASYPRAEIINADVLNVELADHLTEPSRFVGNLPYNISSPLIVRLIEQRHLVRDMHFMLQKEMADRLAATPGTKAWGRLSVIAQYSCAIETIFDVPPEAFEPPPKVTSSVIRMVPLHQRLPLSDERMFDQVLRNVFSARRKRLQNALKNLNCEWDWQALNIDPSARAEQLSVQDFVNLANAASEQQHA